MTLAEPPVEPLHRRLGVTDEELDAIRDRLGGREPNDLELAMFSVMWSEHCSYKSSKPLLRTLPTAGEGVVAGPGENAGVISIGDGLGGRVQDRIAQPPVRGRAVPGRRDRRRRHPARHLHDGRAPDRGPRRAPLRRPGGRADAPSRRRRRARRRRLRQLRRRPDGRRRARLRPDVRGQPARQRHGDRAARGAAPDAGDGWPAWRPGRAVRLDDRARRHRRGLGARLGHVHRRRPVQAAVGAGRRPVRGEAAHRGEPRAHRARPRRGPPGPRGRRHHVRHLGDRGSGRGGDPRRPRRDPAARARPRAVRGDDQRVPGTDVRRRQPVPLAGRARGLHPLGDPGLDHRAGDRRWRHRRGRGRTVRRRDAESRIHACSPGSPLAHSRATRSSTSAWRRRRRTIGRRPPPVRRWSPSIGSRSGGWTRAPSCWPCSVRRTSRLATPGLPPVRLHGRRRHRGRTRARRGGPAGQGHDQGAGRDDRRQPGRWRRGPVAGRGPVRRRGDPERLDHRRPAAGRHELPQLRRPDPARGVLAVERGRAGPGRRVPGARAAR